MTSEFYVMSYFTFMYSICPLSPSEKADSMLNRKGTILYCKLDNTPKCLIYFKFEWREKKQNFI